MDLLPIARSRRDRLGTPAFATGRSLLLPALTLLAGLAALIAGATPAMAQDGPDLWEFEAQAGAALFFGNTNQSIFTSGFEATRTDSIRQIELGAEFSYGEAENDEGETFVNKRSWELSSQFVHRPGEDWSPFISASVQRALERRIDLRYTVGTGAKYVAARSDRGRLDFSLSIQAERTIPIGEPRNPEDDDLLGRWSLRARGSRNFDEGRLTLSTDNNYRPRLDRIDDFNVFSDFVFKSETSLTFRLNEIISLKITFEDNYDSNAVDRGADTNNDGQFLLSVLSAF